ncbi:MAG: ankyrin repeat domain-containing protein [Candidatus Dependentiae bacterium]|nr:ankyrin repeat domain-containing protein [Candidatus Dependentiae bacterium]
MKKIYRLLLALVLGLSFTDAAEALEEKERESKEAAAAKFASLHQAAKAGNVAAVNRMLAAGADVNKADRQGTTVLMIAAKSNHADVVKALIKAGADVNKQDPKGRTALIIALLINSIDIVEELIKAGADVNKGSAVVLGTALMIASTECSVAIVEMLIKAGAEVDKATQPLGQTALMKAVLWERAEVVRILILAGADPYKKDNDYKTALNMADDRIQKVILQALKERGASRRFNSAFLKNEDTQSGSGRSVLGPVMEGMPRPLRGLVADYAEGPFGERSMARVAKEKQEKEQEAAGLTAAQEETKEIEREVQVREQQQIDADALLARQMQESERAGNNRGGARAQALQQQPPQPDANGFYN